MLTDKNGRRNVKAESNLLNGILGMIPGFLVGGVPGALASLGLGIYTAGNEIEKGEIAYDKTRPFEEKEYDEKTAAIMTYEIINSKCVAELECEKITNNSGYWITINGLAGYKNRVSGEEKKRLEFRENRIVVVRDELINDYKRECYEGKGDEYKLYKINPKVYEDGYKKYYHSREFYIREGKFRYDLFIIDYRMATLLNKYCGTNYNLYIPLKCKLMSEVKEDE